MGKGQQSRVSGKLSEEKKIIIVLLVIPICMIATLCLFLVAIIMKPFEPLELLHDVSEIDKVEIVRLQIQSEDGIFNYTEDCLKTEVLYEVGDVEAFIEDFHSSVIFRIPYEPSGALRDGEIAIKITYKNYDIEIIGEYEQVYFQPQKEGFPISSQPQRSKSDEYEKFLEKYIGETADFLGFVSE